MTNKIVSAENELIVVCQGSGQGNGGGEGDQGHFPVVRLIPWCCKCMACSHSWHVYWLSERSRSYQFSPHTKITVTE